MIFSVASQCRRCSHFLGNRACKAYQEIPDKLWNGDESHRKPYPNDNGILFSPRVIVRMPDMED